ARLTRASITPNPVCKTMSTFSLRLRPHTRSTLFPYTTLFRSRIFHERLCDRVGGRTRTLRVRQRRAAFANAGCVHNRGAVPFQLDRKSTRLNSSHVSISYAVFCLKKKSHTEGYDLEPCI